MTSGVILYGPPASGKDTVTRALTDLDPRYTLYRRIKIGPGRQDGYRHATPAEIDQLRDQGHILVETHRYGAAYYADRPGLAEQLRNGIPVVHLAQPDAVTTVLAAFPEARWTVVALTCPRGVAERRLIERGARDVPERLAAWDATPTLEAADLHIDTSTTQPGESASLIAVAEPGYLPRQPSR